MAEQDQDNHLSQYAMELASASVLPMVLKSTIELGVLEIIAKAGPAALLSPSQIASHLPTTNLDAHKALDRMLSLLASHSILTCSVTTHPDGHKVQRLYGLAPVSKYFIRNEDGASLGPLLDSIQDKLMINMWYHMKDAVLEGGLPFNKAYGMDASEYIRQDARYLEIFKESIRDYNLMFLKKILEIYGGFEELKSLVDVGGGDGTVLNMIVSKYPAIKGINFDLPQIIEKSPSYPAGIEHISGDMFVNVPKGDAIFMKWILHSWDDEHCLNF